MIRLSLFSELFELFGIFVDDSTSAKVVLFAVVRFDGEKDEEGEADVSLTLLFPSPLAIILDIDR